MRHRIIADHAAAELALRMCGDLTLFQPGDFAVRQRRGTAGEDQSGTALFIRQREFRIGDHLDIAADQHRFAGSAIARLAAAGIVEAGILRSRQDGVAIFHKNGFRQLTHNHTMGHGSVSSLIFEPPRY